MIQFFNNNTVYFILFKRPSERKSKPGFVEAQYESFDSKKVVYSSK